MHALLVVATLFLLALRLLPRGGLSGFGLLPLHVLSRFGLLPGGRLALFGLLAALLALRLVVGADLFAIVALARVVACGRDRGRACAQGQCDREHCGPQGGSASGNHGGYLSVHADAFSA